MAHNVTYKQSLNQTRLDAIATAIGNGGILKIYDGTQPATPDTAVSTQTLLSSHTCGSPFAGSASAAHPSVLTANAIGSATIAASGTASWFRITTSGGTAIVDGTVGVGSGFDLNVDSTTFVSGQTATITGLTITSAT